MREQVEHAHRHTAHAEAHHHQAQLTNCGVSQDALDVVLAQRNKGRHQRSDGTHPGHEWQHLTCFKNGHGPGHQKYAGRHHRGGMDQRTHRRGAFHRIRQPNVQRQLARLAYSTTEKQQAHDRDHLDPANGRSNR